MNKKNLFMACLALLSLSNAIVAYTVNASNFYKPRAKTLRRIAKNLYLAAAIDRIYQHPFFTPDQQILLKSIPTFISNHFTQKAIIQIKDGRRFTLPPMIDELKKLESIIIKIQLDPELKEKDSFAKALKAIQELIAHLGKVA